MSSSQNRPEKANSLKFFQHVPPSFSLSLKPKPTKLEFLDHSDPNRKKIVRKKAREWVNESRRKAQKDTAQARSEDDRRGFDETDANRVTSQRKRTFDSAQDLGPMASTKLRTFDAFGMLPDVQRIHRHMIQFFLTTPFMWDALPCCDDKQLLHPDKSVAIVARDNSIMWNMARSELSFVVWLYSVVLVRDRMKGLLYTEEIHSWYNEALREIRRELADEAQSGNYSDGLINALACMQATSSFSGMFDAAVMHHSAMTRILKIRGQGDILKGLKQLTLWSRKAIQWCEFFVSAEQVQLPDIPYYCVNEPGVLPSSILIEAAALMQCSKDNLPAFRGSLQSIMHQLHQLGLIYACTPTSLEINCYVPSILYDTEYALIQVLSSQKQEKQNFLDVEILLAETLQLYLWVGPRRMQPQTRVCGVFASCIMSALSPFLPNRETRDGPESSGLGEASNVNDYSIHVQSRPRRVNNLIAWSLALGTVVCAAAPFPDYEWFLKHFGMQMQAMGLDTNIDDYRSFLAMFPKVDGFPWMNLEGLHGILAVTTGIKRKVLEMKVSEVQ